jgi:hypothetical protein
MGALELVQTPLLTYGTYRKRGDPGGARHNLDPTFAS